MKKTYYSAVIIFLLIAFSFSPQSKAQSFKNLDDVPHDISYYRYSRTAPPLVKVLYGRPQKNDQQVFGDLVPFGKLWRTGANEATEIKFYKEVQFGDTKIAAGTYVLLTVPGKNQWEIILNSQTDVLGAFQYNPTFDVARITVPVGKAEELESFSIAFKEKEENVQMVLGWDATRVKIPLHFKKDPTLVKR